MKTHTLSILAGAAGLLALALPLSGQNAARPAPEVSPEVTALIDQLTEQNKQLTANQAALEAKLADLTETLRQARILASRAGGRGNR